MKVVRPFNKKEKKEMTLSVEEVLDEFYEKLDKLFDIMTNEGRKRLVYNLYHFAYQKEVELDGKLYSELRDLS